MAGIFRLSNLKKTWRYLKKNGLREAFLAARERLEQSKEPPYILKLPAAETLLAQRGRFCPEAFYDGTDSGRPPLISIVVPAYRTGKEYLNRLLDSVEAQTYPFWELVLADASENEEVRNALLEWAAGGKTPVLTNTDQERGADDGRSPSFHYIRYVRLPENLGISANTNAGISAARGAYTGLLDHDDLLAPDALYEMADAIINGKKAGKQPEVLYSDEDKCDGTGEIYYEPHRKTDFNLDLLLSNNYICHFLVMKTELLRALLLRPAFDGAQDYDLVLRAAGTKASFYHVGKVLYHWRCHSGSTAENPESKRYAYEAGKRAVEDFCRKKGWPVTVSHLKHLGFYRVDYEEDIFTVRKDIGAIAGPLSKEDLDGTTPVKRRHYGRYLHSGVYEESGCMLYAGLRRGFSGPVHRAALTQNVQTADIRHMRVRPELKELYDRAVSRLAAYPEGGGQEGAREVSAQFCDALHSAGYLILWDPQY